MSQSNLRSDMRLRLRRVREAFFQAMSEEALYDALGPTLTALMSSFTFTLFMAILAVDMARRWHTSRIVPSLTAIIYFPGRLLLTLALTSLWVYGLGRFFRLVGWPRWWAVPYVILILWPCAWVSSSRMEMGADFMTLFLLQLLVVIAYVIHIRNRSAKV